MGRWGTRELGTKELAGTAMLSAMAAVLEAIPGFDVPFPFLANLTFDPVGIPIALAGILYGPTAGLAAAVIGGAPIVLRGRPDSASFKIVAEAATVIPLATVLWAGRKRLAQGGRPHWAVAGLAWTAAAGSRAGVMTAFNYAFLPLLFGLPEPFVRSILPLLAAFNAIQGLANVVVATLIVQRLPPDLKPEWFFPPAT